MTPEEILEHCIPEPMSGCLLYLGATSGGYPKAWVNGLGDRRLHPIICEYAHGPKPSPRHYACHRCDVRLCLEPKHLVWGLPKENVDGTHGRGVAGEHHHWRRIPFLLRGEGNGHAHLTDELVLEIRSAPGKQRDIAKAYGVSQFCVWAIKNRQTWKHLR